MRNRSPRLKKVTQDKTEKNKTKISKGKKIPGRAEFILETDSLKTANNNIKKHMAKFLQVYNRNAARQPMPQ